jgi:hypothetical protein
VAAEWEEARHLRLARYLKSCTAAAPMVRLRGLWRSAILLAAAGTLKPSFLSLYI